MTVSRPKECKQCGTRFYPLRPMQAVCSTICASRFVKQAKKEETDRTKARKAAIKTIPELIKDAQHAFNAYIRQRDHLQPCVCCGQPLTLEAVGGGYDCGHYRSTGSASHLRFHEDNAHGQRKVCNRYGAGRAVDYRIGLIARIGLERVESLENDCKVHKWTRDELVAIKETYRDKLKEFEK